MQGARGIRFGGIGPPPWHRSRLSQPATPPGTERLRQWRYRPSLSVRDQSSQLCVDQYSQGCVDLDYEWPQYSEPTRPSTRQQRRPNQEPEQEQERVLGWSPALKVGASAASLYAAGTGYCELGF